jgi:hypothetical protein
VRHSHGCKSTPRAITVDRRDSKDTVPIHSCAQELTQRLEWSTGSSRSGEHW